MTTRTDALLSQQETGKITASIDPCYGRLSPGAPFINANSLVLFRWGDTNDVAGKAEPGA